MSVGMNWQGEARPDAPQKNADTEKGAIIVIDKRVLFRECLVRCLRASVANRAVLDFASPEEWRRAASNLPSPSLVLFCNQALPDRETEIARELELLYRDCVNVPVVLVSDSEDVDDVLLALQSGARGYMPTSLTLDVAVGAIQLVEAGGTFVPVNCLVGSNLAAKPVTDHNDHISPLFTTRQAAVAEALRQGKPNKQIAYELNMRESTVKLHVRNIMRKLKVKNRTEAAILTNRLGDYLDAADDRPAAFRREEV